MQNIVVYYSQFTGLNITVFNLFTINYELPLALLSRKCSTQNTLALKYSVDLQQAHRTMTSFTVRFLEGHRLISRGVNIGSEIGED